MSLDGASELSKGTAIALAILTEIMVMLIIFNVEDRKLLYKVTAVIYGICASIYLGQWANDYLESKIAVVKDTINLEQYGPFARPTKAVSLNKASEVKIAGDLPVLDGATALYPLYSAFAKATYPQKHYDVDKSEVMCTNTISAYQSLVDGTVDVIFVARPSQEQLDYAKERGVELFLTAIGREAFVFFVNSKNEVSSLSIAQIRRIYAGEITNWKTVGGSSSDIKAFQRPEGSGSQTMLEHNMGGYRLMNPPGNQRVQMMGGIIRETAEYKNFKSALGYSFLYFATEMVKNKEIKILGIDGVAATRANIANRSYPLSTDFYAVTRNDSSSSEKKTSIKKLLAFILSDEGKEIIEKTGYTPLSR
ncbi:PstS family phosphate ABC transporter substrate-binding protein [Pedobacter sp. BAL39]|uniref:PstS family phosphate ABC transporter substrate-binding protein n=1 Tax=Pedobacter sp. BAL39 TaxID=391596 RepID=UPI0012FCF6C7|nr:substrate-binding domain-containing protein [Pedobacter sp. BAL39]